MKKGVFFLILLLPLTAIASSYEDVPLDKPIINYNDKASLQRGAKYYMNYCSGCHSLKYLRYEQLASGVGIVDEQGQVLDKLVKQNLIFTGAKITDPIIAAMSEQQAIDWFGVAPPDLTLEIRSKGAPWVYTYLRSFYQDSNRPLGTNNLLFPDTAMPNVLEGLQGIQVPVYGEDTIDDAGTKEKIHEIKGLRIVQLGSMSPEQFDKMLNDLVNFLAFASEPEKAERHKIGVLVILFLIIFALLAYLLKKSYWKDIP